MKAIYTANLLNRAQAVGCFDRAKEAASQALQGGQTVVLTLSHPSRSKAQNARYWGGGVLFQIASQAMGGKFTAEVWHEQFKRQFIGVDELPNGDVIGKSSTKLSKKEFCDFCDAVEAFAATDLNVVFDELQAHGWSQ